MWCRRPNMGNSFPRSLPKRAGTLLACRFCERKKEMAMRLLLLGAAIGVMAYVFRQPVRGAALDDDTLITHVRIKLDDLMEHPGSVNIEVHDGRVILTGPAADNELRAVVRA